MSGQSAKQNRRHRTWATGVVRACAFGSALCLTGCYPAVLAPRGFVSESEKTILVDSLAIMLAIVVPTITATLAFAWWFRASNKRAKYMPDWVFSGRIEMVTWGVPALTVMLLAGVTWVGSHELDPAAPIPGEAKSVEIQVVSLDWKWLFIYPGLRVAAVNELTVPADARLHFTLTSGSVMNAFSVPQLGSMIYTMNGMATQLNLIADGPGTFDGRSTHFSGDGFPGMHFQVRALPTDDFARWVDQTRSGRPTLDDASYASLARQSADVAPCTFGDVADSLFRRVVSQQIPPAPGPKPVATPWAAPGPAAAPQTDACRPAARATAAPTRKDG